MSDEDAGAAGGDYDAPLTAQDPDEGADAYEFDDFEAEEQTAQGDEAQGPGDPDGDEQSPDGTVQQDAATDEVPRGEGEPAAEGLGTSSGDVPGDAAEEGLPAAGDADADGPAPAPPEPEPEPEPQHGKEPEAATEPDGKPEPQEQTVGVQEPEREAQPAPQPDPEPAPSAWASGAPDLGGAVVTSSAAAGLPLLTSAPASAAYSTGYPPSPPAGSAAGSMDDPEGGRGSSGGQPHGHYAPTPGSLGSAGGAGAAPASSTADGTTTAASGTAPPSRGGSAALTPPLPTVPASPPGSAQPTPRKRTSAFLSCKWPEGSDWAVSLAAELAALGLPAVHDARHSAKAGEVEAMVREASCCVMLVTPGFYHGLANKPPGNRALKEVKWALQAGVPLLAVLAAPYAGQNPLAALRSGGDVAPSSDGSMPWTPRELAALAGARVVPVFKGGDGFDGYQREIARLAAVLNAPSQKEQGGAAADGGVRQSQSGRAPEEAEAEERRLKEILRAAGLGKRAPALAELHIRSPNALAAALRKGKLSVKPHNWSEAAVRRAAAALEAWPVLACQPEWLRMAPPDLVPLLAALLGQEEPREFDRDGNPKPRRGAVPLVTALELGGQGPVVVGSRGALVIAALLRELGRGAASATASRRQNALAHHASPNGNGATAATNGQRSSETGAGGMSGGGGGAPPPPMPLRGSGSTLLTLTLVDLTDCGLGTAGGCEVLGALAGCPTVATLLLGGNQIEDGIASEFAALMRKQTAALAAAAAAAAEAARARGAASTAQPPSPRALAYDAPGSAGPAQGLRTLGLERNVISDRGAAALVAALEASPGSLTELDLSGNVGLAAGAADALARVLRNGGNGRAAQLSSSETASSGSGSSGAAQPPVTRLVRVGLAGCQMDDASIASLLPALLAPAAAPPPPPTQAAANGGGSAPPPPPSTSGVEELDVAGNSLDASALAALAAAAARPGYGGGPRVMNLSGANLRGGGGAGGMRSRLQTAEIGTGSGADSGPGSSGPVPGGNAGALAAALLRSAALEELRLGWCGLGGSGLRTLVHTLTEAAAAAEGATGGGARRSLTGLPPPPPPSAAPAPPAPLARLSLLDLSGNRLGPEGVTLLGALLPVHLPSLRHLLLDECGLGGRELGLLAGSVLGCAGWVVDGVMGALELVMSADVTGGVAGVWSDHVAAVKERERERRRGGGGGGGSALGSMDEGEGGEGRDPAAALAERLRVWLNMGELVASNELKRLMLPVQPAAAAAAAAAAGPAAPPASAGHHRGMHSALRASYATNSSAAPAVTGAAAANGGGAGAAGPSSGAGAGGAPANRLTGLGCLLVHPVVQPVLESLKVTWEALRAEAAANRSAGGPANPLQLPLHSDEARTAFETLNATAVHLRCCGAVAAAGGGLTSLSLARNALGQEAGAALGAALSLSSGVQHLGLRGVHMPPPPAPPAGGGAAAVAAAAAAAAGGPLAAAAAAARDARSLLRLMFPGPMAALEAPPPPPQPRGKHVNIAFSGAASAGRPTTAGRGTTSSGMAPLTADDDHNQGGSHGCNSGSGGAAAASIAAPGGAAAAVAALLPPLRSLDLTDAGISAGNAGHLAELIKLMPSLEQLTLDFNSLGGGASAAAAAAAVLRFDDDDGGPASGVAAALAAGDGTPALFAALSSAPALAALSLNYACNAAAVNAVADHLLGLAAITAAAAALPGSAAAAPPPPAAAALRVLSMVGCPLDGVAAKRLARALVHNTGLAVLRLGGGDPPEGVGPLGSRALGEALSGHKGLVELSLGGTGITDNAVQMLAAALPQLPLLCKLDVSNNSLGPRGGEALAAALMARNRNGVGAAADNRLHVEFHGNRLPEELEARLAALSVPPGMTHAAERLPVIPRYSAPPARSDFGSAAAAAAAAASALPSNGGGGGSGATAAAGVGGGGAGSPAASARPHLPSAPSLVPPPMLVNAPVTRPVVAPPPFNPPRCATAPAKSSPRGGPGGAADGGPLGSGKPTWLTAIPPPPPVRRGSGANGNAGSGALTDGEEDDEGRVLAPTPSKLARIYGLSPDAALPTPPRSRPGTSPMRRSMPSGGGLYDSLYRGGGSPYANSGTLGAGGAGSGAAGSGGASPRQRPAAATGLGATPAAAANGGASGRSSLPAVRKSAAAKSQSGDEAGGGGSGSGKESGDKDKPAPKAHGASPSLTQSIKCHTPDWVQRMQEDYYKKLTAPARPATARLAAPPGPPPEHLRKPLRCQDPAWQRQMQDEQVARECAPEPPPKPVPGAPAAAANVQSTVAVLRRSSPPAAKQQDASAAGKGKGYKVYGRPGAVSPDGEGKSPPAGGVAALLAEHGRGASSGGNGEALASEDSVEMLAVRTTGGRKSAIEVMRITTVKHIEGQRGDGDGDSDAEKHEGGGGQEDVGEQPHGGGGGEAAAEQERGEEGSAAEAEVGGPPPAAEIESQPVVAERPAADINGLSEQGVEAPAHDGQAGVRLTEEQQQQQQEEEESHQAEDSPLADEADGAALEAAVEAGGG
ncbi:hypothetical protein HYH02_005909 [Chlamydomonas schloesseri]|uniref:Uncharacterized protein n=1 Tax=Chlamydomonas schloesseri TaxID=2026947 RepID=A0A835WKP2_9CHLO|nr:hypothetical protein HYH02_005909 [Chlamydomonas schloesseri]|eukprot:KAG2449162.1 hypothetical protein HYH02_005909 [Chlamydomonas schloesseri]